MCLCGEAYVCVAVVTGAWLLSFVSGVVADAGFCVMFAPSAPLLGSGAGPRIPAAVGVCAEDVGGCRIAGGAFW